MTLDDYTRLADDGCPNCPEHVPAADAWNEPDPTILELIRERLAAGWRIVKLRMRWGAK
jgi:hypothetical protein